MLPLIAITSLAFATPVSILPIPFLCSTRNQTCENTPGFFCPSGEGCERVVNKITKCSKLQCKPYVVCTEEVQSCESQPNFCKKNEVCVPVEATLTECQHLTCEKKKDNVDQ